jgi:tRNA 5-methylaminomethyl-2-thiouridine biosynthesis bifunctional protein
MPLGKSEIVWKEGVPVAAAFDDPYYSMDGGLEESRFVFLDGVDINEKLNANRKCVIAETGFGTGLNFLATWQRWQEKGKQNRLIFISTEAYPMSEKNLEQAHAAFPDLSNLSAQLRAAWPPPAQGFHFRQFERGSISLLLMFGDATKSFSRLKAKVDAWYLDGFAPAKNPEMWTDKLFTQIERLSNPGATLATFTAAGFVRRGLSAHGFEMAKTPGFGRKRERLVGHFSQKQSKTPPSALTRVWATTPPAPKQPATGQSAVIIGGGIGGANMAYSLRSRGYKTSIISNPNQPHTSVNLPAAVTIPGFVLDKAIEYEFFDAAYAYCVTHPVIKSAFISPLGARITSKTVEEHQRFSKIISEYDWPTDWLTLDAEALHLPRSGTLLPHKILEDLTQGSQKIFNHVHKIERTNGQWSVIGPDNETIITADVIILAAGIHTLALLKNSGLSSETRLEHPILRPSTGQVEILTESKRTALPQDTLSYGGYVSAPIATPESAFRVLGSTFERMETLPDSSIAPTMANRDTILQEMKSVTGLHVSSETDDIHSWSGLRAMVPDHLPYAGPVPDWQDMLEACAPLARDANLPLAHTPKTIDGLYMLTGLGSKGYQYAPLLAEFIAAMICDEPLPLPDDIVPKLHPARSFVRAIKKHTQ